MFYFLAIDSGAALVSNTFEITHSSNFESRCGVWRLPSCQVVDEKPRRLSVQYSSFWEFDSVPSSSWEFLRICAVVAKSTRSWRSNMIAALIMCTMLLTQTSWKRVTFYKCYGKKLFDLNRWFLQLWIKVLFVLCLLTIVSDAAPVARTFEITNSSNFESRWFLPVCGHLENWEYLCCTHYSSSIRSRLSEIRHSNDPKNPPRGVPVIYC